MSGRRHRFRHYQMSDVKIITTSMTGFLEELRARPGQRALYLTHVTRDDIVLGFLGEHARLRRRGEDSEAALVVCGRNDGQDLSPQIMDLLRDPDLVDAPVMIIGGTTHDATEGMINLTPKLNIDDRGRVTKAVEHYEPYIDFDLLLSRVSEEGKKFARGA